MMKSIKKYLGIRGILGWMIGGMCSLAITSIVVLGYNYSGTHIVNPSGETDYKWRPNQYKAEWNEGINYMRMDDNGFNNLSSDTTNIDILLMGGSHMEAVQFPTKYNVASLLNEELSGYKIYNIGMSGHQFVNCLSNLGAALTMYHPDKYVVIHTTGIDVSKEEMEQVLDGTLPEIPSYDSGVLYQLQKIPSLKVIYKQLMNKLSADKKLLTIMPSSDVSGTLADSEDVSGSFADSLDRRELLDIVTKAFHWAESLSRQNNSKLIIAYSAGGKVNQDGIYERTDDLEWVDAVKKVAEESGIIFIDTYEAFASEYANTYMLPSGFCNSKLGGGHLNKTGHRLIAQEIAEAIREDTK